MAIATYDIPTPTQLRRPTCILTSRGDAAVAVIRLRAVIRDLDPVDRQWIVGLINEMVEDLSVA